MRKPISLFSALKVTCLAVVCVVCMYVRPMKVSVKRVVSCRRYWENDAEMSKSLDDDGTQCKDIARQLVENEPGTRIQVYVLELCRIVSDKITRYRNLQKLWK